MRHQFLVIVISLYISLSFATNRCCKKITVASYKTSYSFWNFFPTKNPARVHQPQIFGSYQTVCENGEQEFINDRPVYRSKHDQGAYGVWFCGDSWYIGYYSDREMCSGFAHSGWQIESCVENIRSFSWRIFNPLKSEINLDEDSVLYFDDNDEAYTEWEEDTTLMVRCDSHDINV